MALKSGRKAKDSEQSLGMLLKRAEQAMVKAKTAPLKSVGLTLAQHVALTQLEQQQGITAASLARACFVSPQAMMILLKTMEQQGLIAREVHPRHANVLELRITDVGREALHGGRTRIAPVERRVLNAFSEKQLQTLRALLTRLAEAFEAE
jgi:DNA-binding MarR family transcriptional regulator